MNEETVPFQDLVAVVFGHFGDPHVHGDLQSFDLFDIARRANEGVQPPRSFPTQGEHGPAAPEYEPYRGADFLHSEL